MNTLLPMTRMLDAALSNLDSMDWTAPAALTPRADILEGEKEFRIVMDLPGIAAADLEISVENQGLAVKAERRFDVPEGFEARRRERAGNVGFTRSFRLGSGVDTDGISANLVDGVLTLTLPKTEQSLPRRIEVK
jgi:HSP20 family protein